MIMVAWRLGCSRVVPEVYWRPGKTSSYTDVSITTFYPDGTVKDCRGRGTIRGRIRTVEAYPGSGILKLTVKNNRNQEYTIILPGWKQSVAPVGSDWWVEVNYGFSEQSEWLRVLAQGHGQVLMYYKGNSKNSKGVDPVLRCRMKGIEFQTARYKSMTCREVLTHFSVLCADKGRSWELAPADTRLINARSALRPGPGTMVLQLVDAFRIKKGCVGTKDTGLTYYWFKIPRAVSRQELVGKR